VLDAAKKAFSKPYPQIAEFELTDYKVRILDGYSGTAAKPFWSNREMVINAGPQ